MRVQRTELLPSDAVENEEGDIVPAADYGMGNQEWVNQQFMIDHVVDVPKKPSLLDVGRSGLSVGLVERAEAIKTIMDYFSYRNKTAGGKESNFGGRYSTPESRRVASGMEAAEYRRKTDYHKAIGRLIDAIDMFDNGDSTQDVAEQRQDMMRSLQDKFGGVGRDYRKKRSDLVKTVQDTARHLTSGRVREHIPVGTNINDISIK